MSRVIYIFLVLFLAMVFQIYLGNIGLIVPLTALLVFYLTIVFDWQMGMLSGVFAGIILDLLYGRTLFISPCINILVSILAIVWLHKGELKFLALQMFPAAILSLLYIVPFVYLTYQQTQHGFFLAMKGLGVIAVSTVISMLLFPCIIKVLDVINGPLGFDCYRTSDERIAKD